MDASEIVNLAAGSLFTPWGCGEPFLQSSESQPPYYRFLNALVREYKPATVVECGVYMATGSVHMAIGNKTTSVVGIDINPHSKAYSAMVLYENFYMYVGDTTSSKILAEVATKFGNTVGILFLDSEHDGITAINEYNAWRHLFTEECIVACDDILDPRMEIFWSRLPGEKLELNFLHPAQYPGYPDAGFGVSIVRDHGSAIEYHHSA